MFLNPQNLENTFDAFPALDWALRWELKGQTKHHAVDIKSEWTQAITESWKEAHKEFLEHQCEGTVTIRGRGSNVETDLAVIDMNFVKGLVYISAASATLVNMPFIIGLGIVRTDGKVTIVFVNGQITEESSDAYWDN